MSAHHPDISRKQDAPRHELRYCGADVDWMIELGGTTISWFFNEPLIALFALAGKGLLQIYRRYLNRLPHHCRLQHIAVRNTLLGSGVLTAAPLMVEGTPRQWLLACLIGSAMAWMVLAVTGCLRSLGTGSK